MRLFLRMAAALAGLAATAGAAEAHKPDFGEGLFADPATAYVVADPAVSIVVYRDVTCERPELWMRLEAPAGFPLFVQLLVPAIDRLADYRPTLAVVGPGLPNARPGVALPPGTGAAVFPTAAATPVLFDERFTGTQDWILVEETVVLPGAGTYYVVAWDPGRRTGKIAVAVGTVEEFGLADFARFPELRRKARAFHELGGNDGAAARAEQVCPR